MDPAVTTGITGGLAFLAGEVLAHLLARRAPNARVILISALGAAGTFAILAAVGVNVGMPGAATIGAMVGGVTGYNLLKTSKVE
jgi:hypothetical protein